MNIYFRDLIILAVSEKVYDTRMRCIVLELANYIGISLKKIETFEKQIMAVCLYEAFKESEE
jgi:hypothetical protein